MINIRFHLWRQIRRTDTERAIQTFQLVKNTVFDILLKFDNDKFEDGEVIAIQI